LTAICVARDCGIINADQKIVLCELKESEEDSSKKEVVVRTIELMKPEDLLPDDCLVKENIRNDITFEIEMNESPMKSDRTELIDKNDKNEAKKEKDPLVDAILSLQYDDCTTAITGN